MDETELEKTQNLDVTVPPSHSLSPGAEALRLESNKIPYDDTTRRRIAYWLLLILTMVVGLAFLYLFVRTNDDCDDCHAPGSPAPSLAVLLPSGRLEGIGAAVSVDGGVVVTAWELPDGGFSTKPPKPSSDFVESVGAAITRPTSSAVTNLIGLMTIIFGPLITLIGTVMGFYFGGKSKDGTPL